MSRCLSSPVQEIPKVGYWDKSMSGVSDASPNVKYYHHLYQWVND